MPATDGKQAASFEQALDWFVVLSSGEVTADERLAFERWLQQPEHRRHWLSIETFQRTLQGMPTGIAGAALRNAREPAAGSSRRRALGVAGAMLTAALLYRRRDDILELSADVRTVTGEQRDMTLADGSSLTLDSGTALDIRFDGRQRRLVLRSGALMVKTAHQPGWNAQPFIVETAQGSVQALGTQFSVRQLEQSGWFNRGRAQLAVLEGEVELRTRAAVEPPLRLGAGYQLSFDADHADQPQALDADAQAWAQGLLVARNQPLGELVDSLRRYRSGVLLCDEAAAALRVTGVFPLDDTDRILDALAHSFPLEVHRHTRFWTRIAAGAGRTAKEQ